MKRLAAFLLVVAVAAGNAGRSAAFDGDMQGFGPYSYGYGIAYGSIYGPFSQFRNRLPAPPYFSIYPPVYYGQRYERPYGDSPFAALPQLRVGPDYVAVPKVEVRSVINPYCEVPSVAPVAPAEQLEVVPAEPEPQESGEGPDESLSAGRSVWIDNPFAAEPAKLVTR